MVELTGPLLFSRVFSIKGSSFLPHQLDNFAIIFSLKPKPMFGTAIELQVKKAIVKPL